MTSSSRGSKAVIGLIKSSRSPRACSDCISSSSRSLPQTRHYASLSAAAVTSPSSSQDAVASIPPVTSSTSPNASTHPYIVNSGILLSRPPIITRPITPFEKSYYLYQKRLNERLAMPFTRYFYHKPDTPLDTAWKSSVKTRNGVAGRDTGGYQSYGAMGWNDEVLIGDKHGEMERIRESLVKDVVEGEGEATSLRTEPKAQGEGVEGLEVLERVTEADKNKDYKSLARKLARTLYLVVKREGSGWGFPAGSLVGRENLHQAAERIIVQSCGPNMNTWIIGHVPAGLHTRSERITPSGELERQGEKTFFMKGRIMAGQADLKDNTFGLEDYRWLTKQEVAKIVAPKYFKMVGAMMGDR